MPKQVLTIVGIPEMSRRAGQLAAEVSSALPAALMAGGMVLANRWKENIVRMGAVETGTYLRSVHPEITNSNPNVAEVTVGTDITEPPYPEYVEFGTSKMPPRPAARNAIDSAGDEIEQEVIDSLKEVFGRYGSV
jgi:HK97 gp10 family phage protein